jgi:acetaldehyde dehydrogenase (acetylating)
VPVMIERSADVPKAVQDILTGKCFDNGTICASEQAVVVDAPIEMAAREQFKMQGGYFLSQSESDLLAKVVATPQRTLNPGIVGKSVEVIANMAGIGVPPGTRCLMTDVGGVGRDYPLSMEKLSPILAFYVEDGLERGAARCNEVLHYGGMGHTAGIHTRSREAAVRYGNEMPASRITVNTPTTHGAIGFSTALPPSMTLGCGSWGGNVTSDNVSPLHLMDIKRVAFETRPVASKRPAVAAQPSMMMSQQTAAGRTATAASGARPTGAPKVSREEIAAIVDRFLANRQPESAPAPSAPPVAAPAAGNEPRNDYSRSAGGNGGAAAREAERVSAANGRKAAEFVSEDDVRRAIQKGEKIYVGPRTIITPSARDIGDPAEVFAKA